MSEYKGAWHGDPVLKAEVLQRMRAHRAADTIIQGLYQEIDPGLALGYRGCLIGCTLPADPIPDDHGPNWHRRVEREYGIPIGVAMVLDDLFELLPVAGCADFAVDSIEAIPVGADLSNVISDRPWDDAYDYRGNPDDLLDRLRSAPLVSVPS